MTYNEILERIENAQTCCELEELRTTIAESCDECEITEAEYHELRNMCDLIIDELPTESSLNEAERDDLNETYYQLTCLQ